MTIRIKLFLSLCLLALALFATSLEGWIALQDASDRTESIVEGRVVPMEQLKTVSDMYAVNIKDTAHKVRSGYMPWADGEARVKEALAIVEAQWMAYSSTSMGSEEKRLAAEVVSTKSRAEPAINKLAGILQAQDAGALDAFVLNELYPAVDPVGEPIAQLMNLQIQMAQQV